MMNDQAISALAMVEADANIPNKLDFAREVRADRLSLLWKITLGAALAVFWVALILTALNTQVLSSLVGPCILASIGCLGANALLRRNSYELAVWAYAGGLMAAFGLAMVPPIGLTAQETGVDILAFVFPVLALMVGLLVPIRSALPLSGLAALIVLIAPSLGRALAVDRTQGFAILLIAIATGIAAQISGELYGIAQWALDSYGKERRTKDQLFDNQQELQRSFMRQRALSEELQATNKELEAARVAAMEAKNFRGQFLANMSHELRTPLNAIIGFSETMLNFPMMYENQTLPVAYKNDLMQIYNSGRHLLQLINDILDLSKVDAGRLEIEIEQVELEPVFGAVLATAAGLVGEKQIELRRETALNLPIVRGDSLRLRQVMLNLLSNAAKFTDTGVITLGAKNAGNGEVLFWVRDTGIGIPQQDMDKIFEEFRQGTSGRRKGRAGSGLGLAISRQLLGLMNGKIWVESKLNEGSTFYFTLPVFVAESRPEPITQHHR
jgi:signal transduction histidine kinase